MTRPLSFLVVPAVSCFFLGLAALPSAKFSNLCNALRGPCPVARRAPSNSPLGPLSAWNHRCASFGERSWAFMCDLFSNRLEFRPSGQLCSPRRPTPLESLLPVRRWCS